MCFQIQRSTPLVSVLSFTDWKRSRVIAVSIPQHEELWSSDSLPGENAGSPVVVQTTSQKSYIALTHNSDIEIPDEDFMKAGHFTLIQADNGYVVWTESEWSRNQLPKGYAPPGVAPKSIIDDGGKEGQNQNDLVVWASNDQQGRGKQGHIFGFQLPSNFDVTENEVLNRSSIVAKQVQWTSKSSPVFGSDGKSMYMGVTGDHLRGWVENTPFEAPADWSSDLSMVDADGLTGRYLR